MKKNKIIAILLGISTGLLAQGIYNNGAKIAIGTGTYLTISGTSGNYLNESNGTDGSIDLNGKISLGGNFTNNVAAADVISTAAVGSEVILSGTANQVVGGTTGITVTLPSLTVNNANGITIAKDVQVNGNLTLTNGLIEIGNNNFTLGSSSIVVGTPSATSMIISNGNGKVIKKWSSTGTFTFPIGEKTLTASYLPVSLSFNSGTFALGAFTSVSMIKAKYNDPIITGSYLNRTWDVAQTGITAFTANAVFQYLTSDVVGAESQISTLRMLPTLATFNPANTTLHQLSATALNEFGTFTGGVGYKTLNLNSIMLEGLYNGSGAMRQAWDDLGPHFTAGTADNITVELRDAANYANVIYSMPNVPLSTTGLASITTIPTVYNGTYYITLKHRNSLETTTATAISFANNTVSKSFGSPAEVFGGNLVQMIDSHYAIFGGDVNQDGVVDGSDFVPVDNLVSNFGSGYISEDANGDGVIDGSDFVIIDNNSSGFVGIVTP